MAKTIEITGGAGGICSELYRALAEDGLDLTVADFDMERAETFVAGIRDVEGSAITVQGDVGDAERDNRHKCRFNCLLSAKPPSVSN